MLSIATQRMPEEILDRSIPVSSERNPYYYANNQSHHKQVPEKLREQIDRT